MKKSLRSPRTHFRACKIFLKFPGDVPPDPPHTIHFVGPHFLNLLCMGHPNPLSGPACKVKMPRLQNMYQIPGRYGEREWATAKAAKLCYIPVSLEGTNIGSGMLMRLELMFKCFISNSFTVGSTNTATML